MLTDKWHSRYFSAELDRRMKIQWRTALEDLNDYLLWCLNTTVMMPNHITDIYLAGINISRNMPQKGAHTLWDYINPTNPTYSGTQVVDAILKLANYKRKINVPLFLKYIPKVHHKKTTHTDNTHYSACTCYMCNGAFWDEMNDDYVDDNDEREALQATRNRWSALELEELHWNAYADDDPIVISTRSYLKLREDMGFPNRHVEWMEYWETQYDYYETYDVEW
jgi:hypothetical protein